MRWSRLLASTALILAGAAFFVLWHFPLLSAAGRVRGFNSDAAILALMGKKMLEGRGFDIFFWGQNYIGPLTSMFIAAWGAVLGTVNPLALRLGVFTEVFVGTVLIVWAIARIDVRAAIATGIALLITPPVLLRMMETPLGAEMAFLTSAAVFAVLMQHVTSPRGHGWLARGRGQLALGVLAGFAWWMNQQIVFTLIAGAIVLGLRSTIVTKVLASLHLRDRLLLRGESIGWRPMPGVVHALAWLMSLSGWLLLAGYIVLDIAGSKMPLFVLSPRIDPLILILTPQLLLPLALGEWRRWRVHIEDPEELRAAMRFAAGWAIGYAPVWLGALAGWYDRTYEFAFQAGTPSTVVEHLSTFARSDAASWIGFSDGAIGILFAIAVCLFVIVATLRIRSEALVLLALVPLANVLFHLIARWSKEHYLISSTGMILGLAAIGAFELWDTHGWPARTALAAIAIVAFTSIGMTAAARHRELLAGPDPMPLLEQVRAANCAVCYTEFWIAYRYRLLDGEQRAWIPYLSQNRTYRESVAAQRLPGQRCLITDEGEVRKIAGDLPLKHRPPGR